MAKHPWMQSVRDTSLCPKCRQFALIRSTTRGAIEDFRKRHSGRRPYRCHECNWRGWLRESQLAYPSTKHLMQLREAGILPTGLPEVPSTDDEYQLPPHDLPEKETREQKSPVRESKDRSGETLQIASEDNRAISGDRKETRVENTVARPTHRHESDEWQNGISFPEEQNLAEEIIPRKLTSHRSSARACPKCGERSLHRSHTRGFVESLRKLLTPKRPYRCSRCQTRTWMSRADF